MVPPVTIANAAVVVFGLLGAAVTLNGFREALVDEVLIGAILLIVAWFVGTTWGFL
jgi:membrane associated rhomboid family serine protease